MSITGSCGTNRGFANCDLKSGLIAVGQATHSGCKEIIY